MNMICDDFYKKKYDLQADLFKLLAHPARLAILDTLRYGEECVCHLEAILGYRQSYLSQQLAILRREGFVQVRRDGWNIYYRVIRPEVFRFLDSAGELIHAPAPLRIDRVYNPDCPCPKCSQIAEEKILSESMKTKK